MSNPSECDVLPAPLEVRCREASTDELLATEWLIANKLGAYASGTVLGTNTRRYHGLLVAATRPPGGRIVALSNLLEQLVLPDESGAESTWELATFEFDGALLPFGGAHLEAFRQGVSATFHYRFGQSELVKEVMLADAANAVAIQYRLLSGPAGILRIRPFVALRDYHELRQAGRTHQMTYLHYHDGIRVEDRESTTSALYMSMGPEPKQRFRSQTQWWYRFRYRGDLNRGQDGNEDLYTPGCFEVPLAVDGPVQLTASMDDPKEVNIEATRRVRLGRVSQYVAGLGDDADETSRRLAMAAETFVAQRRRPNAYPATTIVAGYHWFGSWGRDAMIALPGLLLETRRFEPALAVLRGFAEAVDEGMIPNFFDERGAGASFNSIDASLWFIIAADRYVAASGDVDGWQNHLAGAVLSILQHYHDGTRFDIRADHDGLLVGGDEQTQLTWMDAKFAGRPITPRYGKCVEINALWHAALRVAQRRTEEGTAAGKWGQIAQVVAAAFAERFWNPEAGCLYDIISGERMDDAIRPNQILAVALPDCPLPPDRQRSVVDVVQRELLTPMGLRTLSPAAPGYRGRYGVSWESRDRAYHQGTVWPWLTGPFIEAYLKVHEFSDQARDQCRQWLAGWGEHLRTAGLGFVSEIFDGDEPHAPAGCIAQAWSVAEILRAKRMVDRGRP
ncbi:MAG: amylo-alpha-1,6-glucosidase [Planctomycetota bacterium]|jgi:predicted glycogen debranching enzyme